MTDPWNGAVATFLLNCEQSRSFPSVLRGYRNINERKNDPPAKSVGAEKEVSVLPVSPHSLLVSFPY